MNQKTKEFLNKNEILNSALIGFEFEFYSKLSFGQVSQQLSRILGKKIITAYKTEGLKGEKVPASHTDVGVDYNQYKLEHDFSGGKSMIELVTGPTPLFEAKVILAKVLNWIKDNGKTSERCGIHVNISFNRFSTPNEKIDISSLDPLKFILTFDEDYIFSKFPNRKDNVFARSIDYIFPNNLFSFNHDIKTINRSSFSVPDEKYFGFNFLKLAKGYLELRYLGGKDYENKIIDIIDIMDYSIITIYDCLIDRNYTEQNINRLRSRLSDHKKFTNGIINYSTFKTFYKNIDLYIDLKQDAQLISTYWNEYKYALFDLIYVNGMKSGHINLDIDLHRYQVKDGVFYRPWMLKNYDLIDCRFKNAIFDNCTILGCKIKSSQVFFSEFILDNEVEDSKIKSCYIKTIDNKFTNTYIDNMPHNVKGEISRCIIRSGGLSDLSMIDDKTTVVGI